MVTTIPTFAEILGSEQIAELENSSGHTDFYPLHFGNKTCYHPVINIEVRN